MVNFEPIQLNSVKWLLGQQARFWFIQPRLIFNERARFVPQTTPDSGPTGLDLLRATLSYEGTQFDAPDGAPTFILLPELSIRPEDVSQVRALIARDARPNTIIVFGVHFTEDQARQIEDRDIWDGPSENKFTNCAVIGTGGSEKLYLQPKIVPSQWELDYHWRGKTVRYFQGEFLGFIVMICSELLSRPEHKTTIESIVTELRRKTLQLNAVIWLQHNRRPRSDDFVDSIKQLEVFKPTVFVASSCSSRPQRLDNFAVSGAILPHDALASHFAVLNRPFHYVEPLGDSVPMSRAVLLRYDAHVYRVLTVLAEHIGRGTNTEKSALFQESQPYLLDSSTLLVSQEHFHLVDICNRAQSEALKAAHLKDEIHCLTERLTTLTTEKFLSFFDIAILPQPPSEEVRHTAGTQHPRGDFLCRCWPHRQCIDNLADDSPCISLLADVLIAMAEMDNRGLNVVPAVDVDRRTNLSITLDGINYPIGIVHPGDLNAAATQLGLCGGKNVSVVGSLYIVLGVGEPPVRPSIHELNAARVTSFGAINAGNAEAPRLKAIYDRDFHEALRAGKLKDVLKAEFYS